MFEYSMAAITHRIGCIVPSINVTVEDDFRTLCQANMGVHFCPGHDISGITPDEIRDLVGQVDSNTVEAIVVSCTDLPVLSLIDELEQKHGKPVITSNQATFWQCARILGLGGQAGYGLLLEEHL